MHKVVIKISQGSVVTQTVLGGLTIHLPVANFLCFISAKNYENRLRVDKVIAMNTVCSFFWPTLYMALHYIRAEKPHDAAVKFDTLSFTASSRGSPCDITDFLYIIIAIIYSAVRQLKTTVSVSCSAAVA